MAATIRHCVLGAFTDEATDAQKVAMVQAMRTLPAKIPQICSLVCGLDAGLAPGNHGFAANVEFASAEDYQIYATHPEHVACLTNCIKPILKPGSRTAVQFALTPAALKYGNCISHRSAPRIVPTPLPLHPSLGGYAQRLSSYLRLYCRLACSLPTLVFPGTTSSATRY